MSFSKTIREGAIQEGLRDSWLLEPEDVHLVVFVDEGPVELACVGKGKFGVLTPDRSERPLRVEDGHRPRDEAAPVVAGEDGLLDPELVQHTSHVARSGAPGR